MARRIGMWVGIGVIVAVTLGCGFDFSTARIKDARLSRDEKGSDETDVFLPDETFYLVGTLSNAPDDTQLRVKWTAVDVEGEESDSVIGEKETPADSGEFSFDLSNKDLWPDGKYAVSLYLDDDLEDTLEFQVSATGQAMEDAGDAQEDTAEPDDEGDGAAGGAVGKLDAVRDATIRIVAQGSFVDPEVGLRLNAAGSGSGFIVDPSGLAITNNHVVTGAAILTVRVGDETGTRRAKVLGVSECSDLAVIDVEGDDLPYLKWFEGDVEPGLEVYAAGFPLGEGKYTLTKGIVSQQDADGQSSWASVDHVVQHDATINPGSSGGPLVDEDGRVIGVNYAGDAETDRYYAITRDEALPIIHTLDSGEDVTSIGVNGTAVLDAEADLSGIWVASVASGSPAEDAGIKGGDVITKLEGLQLATDGTMKDYCEILRAHEPGDVLRVEVLRYSAQEVLEGQINGRALERSLSFAQALESDVADATASDAQADDTVEYVAVSDDSEAIAMEVPGDWSDVDGSSWTRDDGEVGVSVTASSDIDAFLGGYGTAGVFFGASRSLAEDYDPGALLDAYKDEMGTDGCTFDGRKNYEDPFYTGVYEAYTDCGDEGANIVAVAAVPEDSSFILYLLMQAVTEADLNSLDHILDTFQTIGDLP
jgi:serine protease Do